MPVWEIYVRIINDITEPVESLFKCIHESKADDILRIFNTFEQSVADQAGITGYCNEFVTGESLFEFRLDLNDVQRVQDLIDHLKSSDRTRCWGEKNRAHLVQPTHTTNLVNQNLESLTSRLSLDTIEEASLLKESSSDFITYDVKSVSVENPDLQDETYSVESNTPNLSYSNTTPDTEEIKVQSPTKVTSLVTDRILNKISVDMTYSTSDDGVQQISNKTSVDTAYSIADERMRELVNTAADRPNQNPDYFDFVRPGDEDVQSSAKPSIDVTHLQRPPLNKN